MLRLAAGLAASTLFANAASAQILQPKRGFGGGINYSQFQTTGAGWYYDWGSAPSTTIGNYNADFYPMFWNAAAQTTIDNTLATNPKYILGYNEPDGATQANMTVAQAIANWTLVSNSTNTYNSVHGTNIKLVSPAVTTLSTNWLQDFMSQAQAASLKVDAIAIHWYGAGSTDGVADANSFESALNSYHNLYPTLPVIVTEFAAHDWSNTNSVASMTAANTTMLSLVIPWMNSKSWVTGYAPYQWFANNETALYTGTPPLPTTLGDQYNGAVASGTTADISGLNLGEHVAMLTGGTLSMNTSAGTVQYINALSGTSTVTGLIDWGLNSASSSNWVQIQPGATLVKSGGNTITFTNGTVTNGGMLQVSGGVLQFPGTISGSGLLNITGTGTAILSAATNTYTGGTNIYSGMLQVSSDAAVSTSVTVYPAGVFAGGFAIDQSFLGQIANPSTYGVIALAANDSNNLNFNSSGANLSNASLGATGTQTYSGTLSPNGTTYRLGGGSGTLVFAGPLSGVSNTLQINPNAASNTTVSLTGTGNTLGGTVTINSGTLNFNYSNVTAGTTILNNNPLSMAGGTLSITGSNLGTTSQTFASTALTADNNYIVNTSGSGGSSNLSLGAITRSVGATVDFTPPSVGSILTTTANGYSGIVGGYATVNGNTWAVSAGNGTTPGAITGLTSYTNTLAAGSTPANYANNNIDITSSNAPSGAITPNSLRFNASAANTLTLTGTNTIASGGILVTSNVGNHLSTITGGAITSTNAQNDLVITNNDTLSQLTIASAINNSTGGMSLTKAGPGTVQLTGALNFTGTTYVDGGTLNASSVTTNHNVTVNNGGTYIAGAFPQSNQFTLTVNSGGTILENGVSFLYGVNFNGGTLGGSSTFWNWQGPNATAQAGTSSLFSTSVVFMNQTASFTLNSGSLLTVTSQLGGNGAAAGLTTSGSGTLILAGANNYTGPTTIGGTTVLQLDSADTGTTGPLGNNSSAGTISMTGGTLQYSPANSYDYSPRFITGVNNQAYNIDTNGQNVSFAAGLNSNSTGGTLTKLGAGALTLNAANTLTGATSINAGTLALGATGTLASTSGVSIASGAAFDISAVTTPFQLSSASATLGGSGTVNGNYNHTVGILSPGATGTVGTLTFNNDLTLAGGTVYLSLNGTNNASGGTVNDLISAGGNLNLSATTVLNANFSGGAPAFGTIYDVINFAGNFTGSISNLVLASPTPALQVVQVGQQVDLIASAALPLSSGSASGNYNVNSVYGTSSTTTAGSLSEALSGNVAAGGVEIDTTGLASGANLALGSNTLTLTSGGWIQIVGPNPYSITSSTGVITTNAAASSLTIANFDTSPSGVTISAPIIDNAGTAVTFSGAGTTVLTRVNTYTGATNISSGASLQITGTGSLASGNYAASITNNGTLRYSSSVNQTLSGAISGSGALIKDTSTSTLTLANANGMTGPVTVNAGTLVTGAANTIGTGSLNVAAGATLNFNGTANNFNGGETWNVSGTVTNTGSAYVYLANTTNLINGGIISGSGSSSGGSFISNTGSTVVTATGTGNLINANSIGTNQQITFNTPGLTDTLTLATQIGSSGFNNNGNGVFKSGLGTVTVTGSCIYSKQTTVNAGTFQIGNGSHGTWANTASFTVALGANLAYDQANNTNNNARTITDNGTVTGLEGAGITNTLSGVISGTGVFVQSGAGTTILSAANTYTGATNVNAGTLALGAAGTLSNTSGISIAAGATFDISAATTPFALSSSAATLGGSGAVNGNYNHTIGVLSPGGPGTVGTLTFNNNLTLSGGTLTLGLNGANNAPGGTVNDLVSVAGSLNLSSATALNATFSGGTPAVGTIYDVINFTGTLIGSTSNLIPPGRSLQVVQNGQQIDLVVSNPTLYWNSTSSASWDVQTSSNWFNTATSANDKFYSADNVNFNDATGVVTNINLTTSLTPGSVTVGSNTNNYTFFGSGNISGSASLTKTGTSTLTMNTSNSYTGPTSANGGVIVVNAAAGLGTGVLTVGPAGQVNVGAAGPLGNSSVIANGIINVNNTTGAGLGSGPLTIGSTGSVNVGSGGTAGAVANSSYSINGTLTYNLSAGATFSNSFNGSGAINLTGGGGYTFNGTASNFNGSINVLSGNLVPGNVANALGNATVNCSGGKMYDVWGLNLSNPLILGTNGTSLELGGNRNNPLSGPVTIAANTTIAIDGGSSLTLTGNVSGNNFNVSSPSNSSNYLYIDGNWNLGTGTLTSSTPINLDPPAGTTTTISSRISSTSSIAEQSGTAMLAGNNSFGSVYVQSAGSVLQVSKISDTGFSNIGGSAVPLNLQGGTFELLGGNNGSTGRTVTASSGAAIQVDPGSQLNLTGKFISSSGNALVNVSGGGILALTGGNFAGPWNILNNVTGAGTTILLGAPVNQINNIGSGATVKFAADASSFALLLSGAGGTGIGINGGGTLDVNGFNQSIPALNSTNVAALVTNNGVSAPATLTIGNTTTNLSSAYSGNLSNGTSAFALTKAGSGTLTLSGGNTYSGPTLVSAGTLLLNSPLASTNVNVSNTAILTLTTPGSLSNAATLIDNGTVNLSTTPQSLATLNGSGRLTTGALLSVTGGGSFSGQIVDGTAAGALNVGGNMLTLSGTDTYTGGTNVSAGTLVLASANAFPSGTSNTGTGLIVRSGATLQIANHGLAATYEPFVSSLTNTGTIDITNNAMVIRGANASIGTISNEIAAAYNGGNWNGTSGSIGIITSSLAASSTTHLTATGIATGLTRFENGTVSASDVLIKYTYYGDANLDGQIDGTDYSRIDYGYLHQLSGWYNGDFNYDNTINGSDYTLIDNTYNQQGVQLTAELATPTAQIAGGATSPSAVPEPTALGLLGIATAGLLGRRRSFIAGPRATSA